MKKKNKILVVLGMIFVVMVQLFGKEYGVDIARASTKAPKISENSMIIPVGKLDSKVRWYDDNQDYNGADALTVVNKLNGATYSFFSKDENIATIDKRGGYVTGICKGTTKIICKQTFNKKTTIIGSCKITVKGAKIVVLSDRFINIPLGNRLSNIDYLVDGNPIASEPKPYEIRYQNPGATYTVKSDSSDFKIEETTLTKEEKKYYKDYGTTDRPLRYKATKIGTFSASIYETYNKKTKKVGSIQFTVHDTEVDDSILELSMDYNESVWSKVNYPDSSKNYYFSIDDYDENNSNNNVIKIVKNEYNELEIKALKEGTAVIKVYEGKDKTGKYLGQYTVKVVL